MKCPKCGYLGFEPVDRCRNCGYEFLLAEQPAAPEIAIRTAAPVVEPLADLAFVDAAVRAAPARPLAPTPELPLFRFPAADDYDERRRVDAEPNRTADIPRAPSVDTDRSRSHGVRRPSPGMPRRHVNEVRPYSLDLALDVPLAYGPIDQPSAANWPGRDEHARDAQLLARLFAVVVDVAILAAIDAAVIYFTLQICGITLADLGILPKGPLFAFLLVQNAGYLVAFTAGGQTLGKMLAGIRVVGAGEETSVDLGRATLRTALWLLLAIPAGLGFLTALFSSDGRGLHDRFAQTRVVRG